VIAGAADKIVKARALAAEDDNQVAGEVKPVVVDGTALVEADDPEVAALEVLEGADEIDDARDAQVLGGARAGFDGRRAQGRGAALGEEDAVDSGAIGNAEQSAEVLRIFDAIESEDEAGGGGVARGGGGREEIFESEELLRADKSDDALVSGGVGGEGELLARLLKDADTGLAALGDEAVETIIPALAGDEDAIESAAAGLHSFLDRVQSVENFHKIQFTALDTSGAVVMRRPGDG
jgi:hypothetical protein